MASKKNKLKPKNGSIMMITAVSICIWIFFSEPGLFLLGVLIFFICVICFKAGVLAKKEAMEKKPDKKKGTGFSTYEQQQEASVKKHLRKDFDPDDPEFKAQTESIGEEIDRNRNIAEQEERQSILDEKHPIQNTP